MKLRWYGSAGYRLIPLLGVTFFSGCMAVAERGFDLLLSPNALENTLFLSSGAAGPWMTFLIKVLVKVS